MTSKIVVIFIFLAISIGFVRGIIRHLQRQRKVHPPVHGNAGIQTHPPTGGGGSHGGHGEKMTKRWWLVWILIIWILGCLAWRAWLPGHERGVAENDLRVATNNLYENVWDVDGQWRDDPAAINPGDNPDTHNGTLSLHRDPNEAYAHGLKPVDADWTMVENMADGSPNFSCSAYFTVWGDRLIVFHQNMDANGDICVYTWHKEDAWGEFHMVNTLGRAINSTFKNNKGTWRLLNWPVR